MKSRTKAKQKQGELVLVAEGVFGWCSTERRSNRYGSVHFTDAPYDGGPVATVRIDNAALERLAGKRVRLTCEVVESRKSGHAGDQFLGITPTQPEIGETVDLGVGVLRAETGYDGAPDVLLVPEDGRNELWIDPRKLYRLHDQTVRCYAEETTAPCSPPPALIVQEPDGVLDNGDGSFQVKGVPEDAPLAINPGMDFERVGHGLYVGTPTPSVRGRRIPHRVK